MMTTCFSGMAGFGPGWGLTLTLIAAIAALTYFLTRRSDTAAERL